MKFFPEKLFYVVVKKNDHSTFRVKISVQMIWKSFVNFYHLYNDFEWSAFKKALSKMNVIVSFFLQVTEKLILPYKV